MIKSYLKFVNENYSEDEHGTLGEYAEMLAKEDDYIKMIIGQMTGDIDPQIRLSNAVNLLDEFTKIELLKRIENYLQEKQGELKVSTVIDASKIKPMEVVTEAYGQNILTTFFKCLTALGLKDNSPQTTDVPEEFLIFFKFTNLESSKIAGVFSRFTSLKSINIDYTNPNMGLYFGIKCDGNFEYGYYYDQLIPIGYFQLKKSTYNSLKLSELKSTSGLKKSIATLSFEDIQLLSKIKTEMSQFNPGYFEQKMVPQLLDRTITFGYLGLGKWDNGQVDLGELENIKQNLKNFLIKFKWSDKILISVKPQNLWILIQIKLK
jgi:hypothetical protein